MFDEPTSALDPEVNGRSVESDPKSADQETTMIIVTHEMAFARDVSSQVIFMDGGCIWNRGLRRKFLKIRKKRERSSFCLVLLMDEFLNNVFIKSNK